MTSREFARASIHDAGGATRGGYRITCRCCPASDVVIANTLSGTRPADDLARTWTRRGWTVGRRPDEDTCPRCRAAARRRTRRPPQIKEAPMPATKAAPPREMSGEDRRLVFAKIHEVYLDARQGYAEGWTDARVALDLGIPRVWVETVRGEFFGPARDNEEIRALLPRIEAALAASAASDRLIEDMARRLKTAGAGLAAIERELAAAESERKRAGVEVSRLAEDAAAIRKAVAA